MSKVKIEALTKRFGEVAALNGIDLSIGEGEFLGLLGPSGCGKSTTLNLVAGFDEPTSGRIVVDGQDVAAVPASKRGMGIVFQSYALFPHMTAAENVAFGLEMRRIERAEREVRTRRALDLVKLETMAERYPRHLSGGQQQRVALARALAIEPKLLLLDEPLSNLDAKLREEMQVELRAIQRRTGITAVIVTHDQAEALAICDRIAVMEAGRISQIGDPLTLYEAPATAFVAGFVGRSSRLKGKIVGASGRQVDVALDGSDRRVRGTSTAPAPPGTDVLVALRPERVRIAMAGEAMLDGVVRSRVFQGSAWLFLIDTAAGLIEALEPNRGAPAVEEGTPVGLSWDAGDAIVVASSSAHG